MADKLNVDFDQMAETIKTFQTACDEIRTAYADIEKALELLRGTQWNSAGKKQYFDLVDISKLRHNVRMHVFADLIANLTFARARYEKIYDMIPELQKHFEL